jgi:hypothetical protein
MGVQRALPGGRGQLAQEQPLLAYRINKGDDQMIGRKATVGLSLLCALFFSAIAVQSAAATAGTNITAFTCTKVAGTGEFKDAHCDKKESTAGGYNHEVVKGTTEIEATNDLGTGGAASTQVLEGSPFKVATRIECNTLTGSGTVENSEPSAKVHKLTGKGTLNYTNCTVVKPTPCTVKEPIVATIGSVETTEGLVGPKGEANAMGLDFNPEPGKPFATVTLEGATCPLKGSPFPVEGFVTVTNGPGTAEPQTNKHSGATAVVTPAMSTLTAAGRPATYEGIATYRMKTVDKTGAAITTTTVT